MKSASRRLWGVQKFVATIYGSYLWCGKLEGQGGDQSGLTVKEVFEVDWIPYSHSICEELDPPSSVCKSCHDTDATLSLHPLTVCSEMIDLGDCQVSRCPLQLRCFCELKKWRQIKECSRSWAKLPGFFFFCWSGFIDYLMLACLSFHSLPARVLPPLPGC